jgi:Host cell surface-exposed lipoprotein
MVANPIEDTEPHVQHLLWSYRETGMGGASLRWRGVQCTYTLGNYYQRFLIKNNMSALLGLLLLVSIICLCIGLAKPSLLKMKSRKQVSLVFGGCIVLFFILIGVVQPNPAPVATATSSSSQAPDVTQSSASQTSNTASTTPPVQGATITKATPKSVPTVKATSTPAPQTDNQNVSPVSTETVSQRNAVAKAINYLNYSAFSHDGLVAQLEYDQFSPADAVYGADNSGANWDEQAAAKAKEYMSYSAFSRGGLITQLEYDKFTQAQAEYGANAVGL